MYVPKNKHEEVIVVMFGDFEPKGGGAKTCLSAYVYVYVCMCM